MSSQVPVRKTLVIAALAAASLLLSVLLGLTARPASASTDVCGGIFADTTWSAADSPFIATCDVVLFPGNTLTIEPGAEVRFAAGTGLSVRGTLIAEGTEGDRVVFTSSDSLAKGAWAGVHVVTTLGGSASIGFADFSYAQTAVSVECCWSGGPVDVADSTFSTNTTALGGYAGWTMTIERSTFDNNTYAITRADKTISDSLFTNNDYGLFATERISVYSSTFTGNQVALYGGRGEVKFSEITNNGTGIQGFFEGFTVSRNTIASNDIGIILTQYDTFTPPVEFNNIHGNTIYNLTNTVPGDKEARNNWWGTTDTAQIDASVFDGFDDPSLGIVHYDPILNEPVIIVPPLGDVSCDELVNVVDALFILQYEVGLRADSGGCPLPPPETLNVAACDVNDDALCNVVDALFILQCEVGIPNPLCPAAVQAAPEGAPQAPPGGRLLYDLGTHRGSITGGNI